MQMLPPAGEPEPATKADVAGQRADERTDLEAVLAALWAFERRFGERLERALKEQTHNLIRWLVGVSGVTLAVAGLVAALT